MQWLTKTFTQLTTTELYDFLKLRIDVFVVEQTCFYADLDDLDRHPETLHILGYHSGYLAAYLRILPKRTTYIDYVSLGRVAIAQNYRGTGLGHELVSLGLEACLTHHKTSTIKISAQEHLQEFYKHHGFKTVTPTYLEDDIPHVGMIKD